MMQGAGVVHLRKTSSSRAAFRQRSFRARQTRLVDWRRQARRGTAGLPRSLAPWRRAGRCPTISTRAVLLRRRAAAPESQDGSCRDGAPCGPCDRRQPAPSPWRAQAADRAGRAHRSTTAGATPARYTAIESALTRKSDAGRCIRLSWNTRLHRRHVPG